MNLQIQELQRRCDVFDKEIEALKAILETLNSRIAELNIQVFGAN